MHISEIADELKERCLIVTCAACEGYNFFYDADTLVLAGWWDEDQEKICCPRCGTLPAWGSVCAMVTDDAMARAGIERYLKREHALWKKHFEAGRHHVKDAMVSGIRVDEPLEFMKLTFEK